MQGAISHFIWAICMSLFVIETAQKRGIRNLGTFFSVFSSTFPLFFYSKKSLKLIPLFLDLLIQWGSVPEEWPSWGGAKNTVSNGQNMLKIAVNTKFHERLLCVINDNIAPKTVRMIREDRRTVGLTDTDWRKNGWFDVLSYRAASSRHEAIIKLTKEIVTFPEPRNSHG